MNIKTSKILQDIKTGEDIQTETGMRTRIVVTRGQVKQYLQKHMYVPPPLVPLT